MELVLYFFVYSFIGWIVEVIYQAYKHRRFINRGFLNGPFLPIYGISAIFLHLNMAWLIPDFSTNSVWHIGILFVFVTILSTFAELVGGVLLYHLFEARWWDYSHLKFNYKGFISLQFSIMWGVMGTLLFGFFHNPLVVPGIRSLDYSFMQTLTTTLVIVLLIDYIFTTIALIDFHRLLLELKTRTDRFNLTTSQMVKSSQTRQKLVERAKQIAQTIKKQETIQYIRQMIDQIKSIPPEEKRTIVKKDHDALKNTVRKITGSRFYKAFPKMRIALKNRKSKKEKKDE